MIYEFTFNNFKSYKSETTIDFTAKPILEFKKSLLRAKECDLLPVCVIYGPNGGGKSNVLLAVQSLRNIVISPCIKNKELFYYKWDDTGKIKPTDYSILFQVGDYKYRYGLSVKDDSVKEENLYIEDESDSIDALFERDDNGIYLCDELKGLDIGDINDGFPLLSYIGMSKNIRKIDAALKFFYNIHFDIPEQHIKIIESNKGKFLNVIQSMGINICDIRIEYTDDGNVKEIYTKHKLENGRLKELKFEEESGGIRKIFRILPIILHGIEEGSFLVIDELDTKLHPALLRKLIELFTNPQINRNGAQMLFTSHDMATMNNEVFRRDEIWFSDINGYDESVLYSLADFKEESGNYSKQYLEGRYGADPYFKYMVNWKVQK